MIEPETKQILELLSSRGMKPGLERMKKLMQALGEPQKKFRTIHVTGSNGKGSVCAMLESILFSAGYRVGLYTSPHLVDACERIRFNKENISYSEFCRWVNRVWNCASSIQVDGDLTYFEMLTAIAFSYFAESRTELAIIEVGLGGRLDATNIIPAPEVCVITNVSLEHTDILGKTIEKIAREKAGIVKKNSTCVTAASDSALKIIGEVCYEQDACLVSAQTQHLYPSHLLVKQGVEETKWDGNLLDCCRLKGAFQKENILVVLKVIEILRENGWEINEREIFAGLQETFLLGRFQEMIFPVEGERIPVLLDGAHNPAAMKALVSAIDSLLYKNKRCLLIFNALRDKDIPKMVRILRRALTISQLLIPALDTERSHDPQETAKIFLRVDRKCSIETFASVQKCWEAISSRKEIFSKTDWILLTGSLYLVGETLKSDFLKPMVPFPSLNASFGRISGVND